MKEVSKKFYSDAGHGWMAVKLKELAELDILDKITVYSYYKGKTAYLEEDLDCNTYIKACKAKGIKVVTVDKYHWGYSPIRSYNRFPTNMKDVYEETMNG